MIVPATGITLLVTIVFGLLTVLYMTRIVEQEKPQVPSVVRVSALIRDGALVYLKRQSRTILVFLPVLTLVIFLFFGLSAAVTSVVGSVLSMVSSYVGLVMIIGCHPRVTEKAKVSPGEAFRLAFSGGSVLGILVPVLGLAGLTSLYLFLGDPNALIGFGFGSSLTALFAQVGGGIFSKAADIGADLVGKVELGLPEDDPRNPAVIADLTGDNVGDCAGRAADLFQSFSGDVITGMILGVLFIGKYGYNAVLFPLLLQAVGILASNCMVFVVGYLADRKTVNPLHLLNQGLYSTAGLSLVGAFILSFALFGEPTMFYSAASGIVAVMVSIVVTKYYTSTESKPVGTIARGSLQGPAINILTGISYGLQSVLVPVIAILGAAVFSFLASGMSLYAVAVANIGTDLMIGYVMSSDAFGPIVDNANGVAELTAQEDSMKNLDALDAVGNTMKAYSKALSMTTGTLTAVAVFITFIKGANIGKLDLLQLVDLAYLFVGSAMTFMVSSLLIGATAKTAAQMVDEIRQQFKERPGILEGLQEPDYAKCIDVSTRNALKQMAFPALVAVFCPLAVGLLFSGEALLSFLIGVTLSSMTLAIFFSVSGTAFDNAKKIIEAGNYGGKGSDAHKASVTGDTVGDPFKDVLGPSLVIFMKVAGMTSLLLLPILAVQA